MQTSHLTGKDGFDIYHIDADPLAYTPPFSFTVGLGNSNLPELIVFALNADVAEEILRRVIGQLLVGRMILVDGANIERAATVQLRARELGQNLYGNFLPHTVRHAEKSEMPLKVFQLVLPDPNGRFPGDVGCDAVTSYSQTIEAFMRTASDSLSVEFRNEPKIRF